MVERRFWIALVLYAALAVAVWMTLGDGTFTVQGRQVPIRYVPLAVLATFALRTVLFRQAEQVRRGEKKG